MTWQSCNRQAVYSVVVIVTQPILNSTINSPLLIKKFLVGARLNEKAKLCF